MATEPFVLDEEDEGEGDGPVAKQRHKIRHNRRKVVLARNGDDRHNQRSEETPDEAGDGVEVVAEQLKRKATGVEDRDVVADDGEGQDHERKLRPSDRVVRFDEHTAKAVVGVCGGPGGILCEKDGIAEASADDRDEDGGNGDAGGGEAEDFPR